MAFTEFIPDVSDRTAILRCLEDAGRGPLVYYSPVAEDYIFVVNKRFESTPAELKGVPMVLVRIEDRLTTESVGAGQYEDGAFSATVETDYVSQRRGGVDQLVVTACGYGTTIEQLTLWLDELVAGHKADKLVATYV